MQDNLKTPTPAPACLARIPWACPGCSFLNKPAKEKCAVCATSKPREVVKQILFELTFRRNDGAEESCLFTDSTCTLQRFKEIIAQHTSIPPARQKIFEKDRLVKGRNDLLLCELFYIPPTELVSIAIRIEDVQGGGPLCELKYPHQKNGGARPELPATSVPEITISPIIAAAAATSANIVTTTTSMPLPPPSERDPGREETKKPVPTNPALSRPDDEPRPKIMCSKPETSDVRDHDADWVSVDINLSNTTTHQVMSVVNQREVLNLGDVQDGEALVDAPPGGVCILYDRFSATGASTSAAAAAAAAGTRDTTAVDTSRTTPSKQ